MPKMKKMSSAHPEVIEMMVEESPKKELIAPLGLDLGREDLNAVVGKLNEIIRKLNE